MNQNPFSSIPTDFAEELLSGLSSYIGAVRSVVEQPLSADSLQSHRILFDDYCRLVSIRQALTEVLESRTK